MNSLIYQVLNHSTKSFEITDMGKPSDYESTIE